MVEELPQRECQWCDKPFYVGRIDHKFCSAKCHQDFYSAERKQAIEHWRKLGMVVVREERVA